MVTLLTSSGLALTGLMFPAACALTDQVTCLHTEDEEAEVHNRSSARNANKVRSYASRVDRVLIGRIAVCVCHMTFYVLLMLELSTY